MYFYCTSAFKVQRFYNFNGCKSVLPALVQCMYKDSEWRRAVIVPVK